MMFLCYLYYPAVKQSWVATGEVFAVGGAS